MADLATCLERLRVEVLIFATLAHVQIVDLCSQTLFSMCIHNVIALSSNKKLNCSLTENLAVKTESVSSGRNH